jgi:phosphate butyryltransferase
MNFGYLSKSRRKSKPGKSNPERRRNALKIKTLEELRQHAIEIGPKKISVANPAEDEIFHALIEAYRQKIIIGYLVGNPDVIVPLAKKFQIDLKDFKIVPAMSEEAAAATAIKLVRDKEADFLMKGTVSSATYLKAVLDKETGLRKPDHLLSHVAIFEIPEFSRLLLITDVAVNIKPDVDEKAKIIDNAVKVAHVLGLEKPKVACVAAIEKVNPKLQSTVDAAELAKMAKAGRFPNAFVEGPFGFDNAIDSYSAEIKGITGDVAGKADILLTPDMDSGNMVYKTLTILAKSLVASILVGTTAPVILTSRADSAHSKLLSLALGALDSHYSY